MRRDYIVELIKNIVGNEPTAIMVVDRLEEEGLLNVHFGNQDIGDVVQAFTDSFGTTRTSKYDRFSAKRLVDKHGKESIIQIIKILASLNDRPFCPSVNNISDLEKKFPQVIKFLRSNAEPEEITI